MKRGGRCVHGLLAAWVAMSFAHHAMAVEVTIDNFVAADKTKIVFTPLANRQILVETQGTSKTATDFGLAGVLGGVRQLTVTATLICGTSDFVMSGVDLGFGLCFNAGAQEANGLVEMLYDQGGVGLPNVDLSHAMGIKVPVLLADPSSVPYTVETTLADDSLNSMTVSRTSNASCLGPDPCVEFMFPFSEFMTVNLRRIVSVKVRLIPNGAMTTTCDMEGDNPDIFLGPIETYGTPDTETSCDDGEDNDNNGLTDCQDPVCSDFLTCRTPAPLLSPHMLAALVAMLSLVGLVGMIRTWRAQ